MYTLVQSCTLDSFEVLFLGGFQTLWTEIGCLFDISLDPCEQVNLVSTHPEIVKGLKAELQKLKRTAVEPTNGPKDPQANPKYWGYIWTHWKDL